MSASSFEIASAPYRLIVVAATGEPESTKYAPSHPVPSVESGLANGNEPSIDGPDRDRAFLHQLDRRG